jgi:hypothetical protein
MNIRLHSHALERLKERGATQDEAMRTVREGRSAPAKFDRTRFTRIFAYNQLWHGKLYASKQVEAYASRQPDGSWLIITVIVKFF